MQMTDEAKEARNAYMREWCRRNKEKRKESQKRYWEKKARERKGDSTDKASERA